MSVTAVIGSQWGDEGKGKIVDILAQDADMVIRFNGGNNAGHTVQNNFGELKLHIIPVGICNPNTINIIGSGCYVDIFKLVEELNELKQKGITCDNLLISKKAHLVMPWHIEVDEAQEKQRDPSAQIGTTKRGMGPCASDKYDRRGLRAGDLLNPGYFKSKFKEVYEYHRSVMYNTYKVYKWRGPFTPTHELFEQYMEQANQVISLICNTEAVAQDAVSSYKNVLLEGAQAIGLDIDHGTYPFCTSSACGIAAASQGSGIPAHKITNRIAVVKAYPTRIGPGAFPTRIWGEMDDWLREKGAEYGATTGRPRMCGWIDLPMLRYAQRLNNFTSIAVTKLDVLSGIELLPVGKGYECKEGRSDICVPYDIDNASHMDCAFADGSKAIYDYVDGWQENIRNVRSREELPEATQNYIQLIEQAMDNTRASFISVGPDRNETILPRRSGGKYSKNFLL